MSETRVRITPDTDPTEPYDDGSSPLFRLVYRFKWSAFQITETTSYRADASLIEGIETLLNTDALAEVGLGVLDTEIGKRYLSIWFGATKIETWHSGNDWYLTCDPEAWRQKVGAAEGSISMAEWQAYCTGDVYGVIPETLVPWTAPDGRVNKVWEDTTGEGCWGFYGIDAAREYAAEMFPGVKVYEG